ncbi:MAG: hypothetical protein ACYC33_07025 [Thermoleophilia bacterium]
MSQFELRPVGTEPHTSTFRQLIWGVCGEPDATVQASVDPWLSQFGSVAVTASDLVRIVAAAYMADRQTRRGEGYSRTIELHVQLSQVGPWGDLLGQTADLLHWLTADHWIITVSADGIPSPKPRDISAEPSEDVMLLSGGLDSLAGALARKSGMRRIYVGHWDNPTVKASQDRTWSWLKTLPGVVGDYTQVRLCEQSSKRENSTRSRCLLFFALATAIASANACHTIEVPENGFTSLNLALGNNRGGVLSTRSTHPLTLMLFNSLLDKLRINVQASNPFGWMTKGELVAAAAAAEGSLVEGVPLTLSCGKLDGRLYRGGNPNCHCGWCVACLTRRGALLSAGLPDRTQYLFDLLGSGEASRLLRQRTPDLRAVRAGIRREVDEFALLAQGPYPEDYDLSSAVDLHQRGLAELELALPE